MPSPLGLGQPSCETGVKSSSSPENQVLSELSIPGGSEYLLSPEGVQKTQAAYIDLLYKIRPLRPAFVPFSQLSPW